MSRAVMLVLVSDDALRAASKRRPDALFVHASRPQLARGGFVVCAPPDLKRFFVALAANAPNFVPDRTIVALLFGHRRDGGPEHIRRRLLLLTYEARAIAPALGYVIERMPGGFRALPVGSADTFSPPGGAKGRAFFLRPAERGEGGATAGVGGQAP